VDDYPGNDREIGRAWLRGELDMGPVRFTSITHFGQGDVLQNEDAQRQGDHSNLTIAAVNDFKTRTQLLTQELRLQNTDVDSRLNWTVGGLYWFENVSQTNMSLTCFLPTGQNCGEILRRYHAAGLGQREFFRRKTHHYSAYALVEFDITEQLGISAEVRHTWEDEDLTVPRTVDSSVGCSFAGASLPFRSLQLNGTLVCAGPPGPPQPFRLAKTAGNYGTISTQNKFWAPRVGVDYKINDELLVYASVAKGVKPGGVSTLGGGGSGGIDFVSNAYEREQIWVYEIGEKSTLFDGSVQFNVAGYYQDFSDKQASTQLVLPSGSTGTRIVNAAKARVWGVDVEGAWAATENLTLTLGYTWNDAKFKEYKLLQSSLSTITSVGNCTQVRTPTNALLCELDRSGYTLERSPKHSLQFTPTWRAPIAGGDLNYLIEASFLYTSERFESDDNQFILPSYWVVDMRIGLQNDNFEIIGYVNNMFNDDTIKSGFASPDFVRSYCLGGAPCNFVPPLNTPPFNFVLPNHFTAALPDKRQFGIRASYKF
jgi:outer membrane receptor protein involved in Fe transport